MARFRVICKMVQNDRESAEGKKFEQDFKARMLRELTGKKKNTKGAVPVNDKNRVFDEWMRECCGAIPVTRKKQKRDPPVIPRAAPKVVAQPVVRAVAPAPPAFEDLPEDRRAAT